MTLGYNYTLEGGLCMPRISKEEKNIVPIPMSVSVTKKGYVYVNRSTTWVKKANGQGKRAEHEKVCIGIALHPGSDWAVDRRMYANSTYYKLYPLSDTPNNTAVTVYDEYPERYDCISVGLYAATRKAAEDSGLMNLLIDVFGSKDANLILDLAMYMISEESAVFQHFPHWAASHAINSDAIRSDSYISAFAHEGISVSKINAFKKRWAVRALDDGRIFICYDSTNVNSQAEGVFIVQKGHAKDDPEKEQVNTEYAIRQRDGMPITFKVYPGSINDISEAFEMIQFLGEIQKEVKEEKGDESSELEIVIIADRGYVSEKNIKELRDAEIGYILLLKKNMIIADEILQNHLHEVKKPGNYLNDSGKFALTVPGKLFEDDEGDSYFHIVWDGKLETAHRYMLMNAIEAKEQRLRKAVERKTRYTEFEIDSFKEFFFLQYHQEGRLKVNMHGRGAGKKKEIPSYVIDSFARNNEAIEEADRKCGYLVYVTHRQMTAKETLQAVSKRDCVEKTFRALKGWMGMDKFGVHSESSMHSKNLIWFVASIIRSLIFTNTENARTKDKKRYTLPSIIDQLEEIRADKELSTGQYQRRYKPTKIQSNCLQMLGIKLDSIDEIIAALGQEAIVDDL